MAIESLIFCGRGTDQTKAFQHNHLGVYLICIASCTMVTVTCKPFTSRPTSGRASVSASRRLPIRCSLNADEGPGSSDTSRRCSFHAGRTLGVWLRLDYTATTSVPLRPDHPAVHRIILQSSGLAWRREFILGGVNVGVLASLFTFGAAPRPSSIGIQVPTARRRYMSPKMHAA